MIVTVSPLVAERYGEHIRAVAPGIELMWPREDGGWTGDAQAAAVVDLSEDL